MRFCSSHHRWYLRSRDRQPFPQVSPLPVSPALGLHIRSFADVIFAVFFQPGTEWRFTGVTTRCVVALAVNPTVCAFNAEIPNVHPQHARECRYACVNQMCFAPGGKAAHATVCWTGALVTGLPRPAPTPRRALHLQHQAGQEQHCGANSPRAPHALTCWLLRVSRFRHTS